jgi:magnesium transporter
LRAPWLLFCLAGQLVTVNVLHLSENRLGELFLALVLFTPAIIAMGGNVGTQAATIVVRGLATGRVHRHDLVPVLWREVRTSLLIAAVYGVLLATVVGLFFGEPARFCLVVGLGLVCSMVLAAAFGTLVPIGFHSIGVDPAVATGPLVTTAMDVVGVGAYFGLAGLLLTAP